VTPGAARIGAVLALALLLPTTSLAQGYRLRLDAGVQSVRFRGYQLDSVAISDVDTLPDGSLESDDGFAVQCRTAAAYCSFFRPGAEQASTPFVAAADLTLWGLGIRGLSVRLNGRYADDLSDDADWPGTEPGLQLVEGYVEYAAAPTWSVRAGRQVQTGRLGYYGYDGGRLVLRAPSAGLEATGYSDRARPGRWCPSRAAANPDEYRRRIPARRSRHRFVDRPVLELNGDTSAKWIARSDYATSSASRCPARSARWPA
jgi:hypothetical protein